MTRLLTRLALLVALVPMAALAQSGDTQILEGSDQAGGIQLGAKIKSYPGLRELGDDRYETADGGLQIGTDGCNIVEIRAVEKRYLALVEGEFPAGEDRTIDRPLAPVGRRGGRMRVDAAGKPSTTIVRVVRAFRGYTWVECRPLTGRTPACRSRPRHRRPAGAPWMGFCSPPVWQSWVCPRDETRAG